MLNLVLQGLEEMGLLVGAAEPRYYVNITTGDALSISVFLRGGRWVQVKASEFVDLQPLCDSHCRAWQHHADVIARPIGHVRCAGWSIFACEGLPHALVRVDDVLGTWLRPRGLRAPLERFFEVGGAASRPPEDRATAAWLEQLRTHFQATPLAALAHRVVRQAIASGVAGMHRIEQHGDFVVNNLGLSASGLVVFDWEDYGKIELPGFDVFTLCLSMTGFDAAVLKRIGTPRSRRERALSAFVARSCRGHSLSVETFIRLLPLYALGFLHLKRHYGASIQARATDAFLLLCGAVGERWAEPVRAPQGQGLH